MDKSPKSLSIKRTPKREDAPQPELPQSSSTSTRATGGIALGTSSESADPFKEELATNHYVVMSEDDYGVTVVKGSGRPTFLPRTQQGYLEPRKNHSLYMPASIQKSLKLRAMQVDTSINEYLIRLIIDDLKEKGFTI